MGTYNRGFTLIELAIALLVIGILTTVAIPGFRQYLQNTKLTTTTNDLVAALNVARTTAIGRNTCVMLCRASNTESGSEACGGTAKVWSSGWLLYLDPATSACAGSFTNYASGSHELVRVHAATDSGLNILSNTTATQYIEYQADGTLNSGSNAIFAVCDDRLVAKGRALTVSPTGHVSLNPATDCSP